MEVAEQLFVNRLLASVDEYKASDLLLSVGNPPTLRVQGRLIPLQTEQLVTPDFMRRLSETWLTEDQQTNLKAQREVAFARTMPNRKRFKIGVFYQSGFLSMSLRLIPERIPPLAELGLPAGALKIAQAERGLVIVCGPFGSGRTTTVSAMINEINKTKTKHVVTLEDPVEFLFEDDRSIIDQRNLGTDIQDLAQALEFMLGEDVDVLVLSSSGEAVMKQIMDIVASGRLVVMSMNTDSAVHALEKIINSFPGADQPAMRLRLSNLLTGIMNQRIVPKMGGGQLLVAEVLIPTQRSRSIIQAGDLYQLSGIMQAETGEGSGTLDQALGDAARRGDITRDTALNFALDQRSVMAFMTGRPVA